LRELLDREPGIGVDLRYVSNQNSLVSLAQGACDLSGVHLPRGELRAQGIRACKEWLDPREDRVISFVTREMGLMVKRGNPLKIASIKDVVERKARFVNRDHDSGTRLLFDQLLALHKVDEAKINGAQQMEFTHAAVAAYVASGMADVSFGVEAAARQFGLDFIRLLTEDYFFVCKRARLCENVFPPPKTARNRGRSASTRRSERIFAVSSLESTRAQPQAHAERPERSHDAHNSTSSSRPDCHQERLDADDVHYAREVVGEYVQRHFGRDIGQPLH